MSKDPFEKAWPVALNALSALDARAEKHMHDRRYTADGVLLVIGLEVWCVDYSLGDHPWKISKWNNFEKNNRISLTQDHGDGWTKRDARFSDMYAHTFKAINARMDVIAAKKKEIFKKQIEPINKELMALANMAAKEGGLDEGAVHEEKREIYE